MNPLRESAMNPLRESAIDLLWSLWSELGVPGSGRRHGHLLLDPEPLIVSTPCLAGEDNRLLGLASDWCAARADLISRPRMTALVRAAQPPVREAFLKFAGALVPCGIKWTSITAPEVYSVQRRVIAMPLERPALLGMRMRMLVGVSARAEVLTRLVAARSHPLSIIELTPSGISRRSVERVIAELELGSFLSVKGGQRRRKFALNEGRAFAAMLGIDDFAAAPAFVDWQLLFPAIFGILALSDCGTLPEGLRRVEAARHRGELARFMSALGLREPPQISGRSDAFERMMQWGSGVLAAWAAGKEMAQR
jgi:hypothetical protein